MNRHAWLYFLLSAVAVSGKFFCNSTTKADKRDEDLTKIERFSNLKNGQFCINCKFRTSTDLPPNTTLKVVVYSYKPFIIINESFSLSGYSIAIIETLSHITGLKIEYHRTKPLINNDLSMKIKTGVYDLLSIPVEMSFVRLPYFSYLPPIYDQIVQVAIRHPSTIQTFSFDLYFTSFSLQIWIFVALTISISTLLSKFIEKRENKTRYQFGAFNSQRIIDFSLYLLIIPVLAVYSSFLTAALTISNTGVPFENVQDLIDHGYKLALVKGSAVYNMLQQSKFGLLSEMRKASEGYALQYPELLQEGPYLVATRKIGFVCHQEFLRTLGMKTNCTFVTIKQPVMHRPDYMVMSKGSPLVETFSKHLLLFKTSGVLQRMKDTNIPNANIKCDLPEVNKVGFKQTISAFIILASGVIIAVIAFFVEAAFQCIRTTISV